MVRSACQRPMRNAFCEDAGMTDAIKDRLQQARLAKDILSPTAAARAYGWKVSTYLGYENGDREPGREAARRMAEAYSVSLDWLLTGRGERADARSRNSTIPIMGRIGAGAEIDAGIEQVPPEGYYDAEAVIPLPPYAIGFEVVGDSMVPRYGPGDVVVCPRDGTPFERIPDGEEAAVLTADGRRFLKFALRTAVPNVYNLISVNATASPILGVELTWAADVLTVVRARQWSRVTHDDRRRLSTKVSAKRGG